MQPLPLQEVPAPRPLEAALMGPLPPGLPSHAGGVPLVLAQPPVLRTAQQPHLPMLPPVQLAPAGTLVLQPQPQLQQPFWPERQLPAAGAAGAVSDALVRLAPPCASPAVQEQQQQQQQPSPQQPQQQPSPQQPQQQQREHREQKGVKKKRQSSKEKMRKQLQPKQKQTKKKHSPPSPIVQQLSPGGRQPAGPEPAAGTPAKPRHASLPSAVPLVPQLRAEVGQGFAVRLLSELGRQFSLRAEEAAAAWHRQQRRLLEETQAEQRRQLKLAQQAQLLELERAQQLWPGRQQQQAELLPPAQEPLPPIQAQPSFPSDPASARAQPPLELRTTSSDQQQQAEWCARQYVSASVAAFLAKAERVGR